MTLNIFDVSSVNLNGTITSTGALDLLHGTQSLANNGNSLFNELDTLDDAEVVAGDFTHNGSTHAVYAWEALPDGSLSQWTRQSNNSRSGSRDDVDRDVLMIAVPPGVSVPEPTSTQGPPAPGTSQTVVRIKIRKQGDMPF